MDLANTKRGVKRPAECESVEEPTTSNVTNSVVGASLTVSENARVSINKITVIQQQQKQPSPDHTPHDIDLQVADPILTFRGRDHQLEEVKNAFSEQKNMEPFNLVTVCGYGGIGKTEFARRYVQCNQEEFENTMWINAEFECDIQDSFGKLQKELKCRGFPCCGLQDTYRHLNNVKCLFVFDNVENMRSIRPYLPNKNNESCFLITSQFKTWSPYKSIELSELDSESATNIMKAVLDTHKIEITQEQLQKLDSKFERIPLVIQIVAGFICQEVLDLRSAGTEYNIEDIIQDLDTDCEVVTEGFPDFSTDPYSKSIYEAISRTLKKIWTKQDAVSKTAANILGISAYLNADDTSKDILNSLLKIKDKMLDKALAIVVQYSLFQKTVYGFRIHRTVQQCIRKYIQSTEYYSQTLPVLLNEDYFQHHKTVIQHGENDADIFCTFYKENECRKLYMTVFKYASCTILIQLLNKISLIRNPEFLCTAAGSGRHDVVQLLQDRDADFNTKDDKGFGVFHYIWHKNYFYYSYLWDTINILIQTGAEVNSQNSSGATVLHTLLSSLQDDYDLFELFVLLIKQGANSEIRNSFGETAIDLARKYKLPFTLQLLESAIDYRYILHITAKCKQFNLLVNLIGCKICNFDEIDNFGCTVFHVLAGLDEEDDEKIQYVTTVLLRKCPANIDIKTKNKDGETPAEVAGRSKRKMLADLLNEWAQPGCIVFNLVKQFSFVSSENNEQINEQDNTGRTLLHALCYLDSNNNTELEQDIIRLVAHLVVWHYADVHIKDNAGETAGDVARRRGLLFLADVLDVQLCEDDLVEVAVKHREFNFVKYVWRRYIYLPFHSVIFRYSNEIGCRLLNMLCVLEDPDVSDNQLIDLIGDLELTQVARHCEPMYHAAVEFAEQFGRAELAAWLREHA